MKTRKSVLFIITSGITLLVICCIGTVGCFIGFRNAAAQETKSNNSGAEQFLRALSEARAKSNAGEWKDAAALWEKVVRLNPVTGEFWYRLGEARYKSADYRNAIPAYEQALRLGVVGFPSSRARDIARCHAMMGEKEQALKSLEKAFAIGYRRFDLIRDDPAFQSLHMEPRFQALVAAIDTGRMSRTEGWRYDLQLLAREVKRRRYDPFRSISEADFDGAVKKIHDSIPHLTDMRITIEMMRLLARVRDGHTLIFGIAERPEFRRNIPVDLSFFEEGLFITAAEGKHEDLLGARVLRFGERTVEEVLSVMNTILSRDNERAYLMAGIRLRNLPILHGLGLIPEADKLLLTVSDIQGKVRTITLTADSDIPSRRLWDQLPDGWKSFHQTLGGQPPLYLKNIYADYWFEYLPEAKTVYFQFNHVRNNEQEPLARFCERLFGFIDEREVEKLVIDMRWNNGGDTTIVHPLIHGLIRSDKINRRGKLFVVIGRRTFSAAQNTATYIERHTRAIFVGEPTGSSPNFIGEESIFELPYSKLMANVSDLYWQSSWPDDHRQWIAPLLYTPPTFEAYRANCDPAMEAILSYRE